MVPRSTFVVVFFLLFTLPGQILGNKPERMNHRDDTIVFGGGAHFLPFEWSDSGIPRGFNIDIEEAIGNELGLSVTHILGDWPAQIAALRSGEIDALPLFASEQRAKHYLFTDPFYYLNHAVFSLPGAQPVTSVEQLRQSTVAVKESSYAHTRLSQEYPDVELVLANNTLDALRLTESDSAEYALVAMSPANHLVQRHRLTLENVGPPFWPRPYVFAINKDLPESARLITEGLNSVIANGRYREIHGQWKEYLETGSAPPTVFDYTVYVIGILAGLALLMALWAWSTRKKVIQSTSELQTQLDLTEQAEFKSRFLAEYDPVTELPRLPNFLNTVDEYISGLGASRTRHRIIVLALVDLKTMILSFGHEVGDAVAYEFARRLIAEAPKAGRIDRETFVILIEKDQVADFFDAVSTEIGPPEFKFQPMIRAGSANFDDDSQSASDVVRHAETALEVAIVRGSNWQEYSSSMEVDEQDLKLVADFKRDKAKDLHCVYQPQVDVASNRIVGAEALIRWNHPTLGPISPNRFIPLLEQTGLTNYVTEKVIAEAVRFSARLRSMGLPSRISVNVSPRDFLLVHMVDFIDSCMERYQGRYEDLKLEITETSFSDSSEIISTTLRELNDKGVTSSIDDFGTGYSSLSYLSAFPISEIKIDRIFICDFLKNDRHLSIVRSTIALAHELNLSVVAEGVEDRETMAALRQLGCEVAQGFHISKPITEQRFIDFASVEFAG